MGGFYTSYYRSESIYKMNERSDPEPCHDCDRPSRPGKVRSHSYFYAGYRKSPPDCAHPAIEPSGVCSIHKANTSMDTDRINTDRKPQHGPYWNFGHSRSFFSLVSLNHLIIIFRDSERQDCIGKDPQMDTSLWKKYDIQRAKTSSCRPALRVD